MELRVTGASHGLCMWGLFRPHGLGASRPLLRFQTKFRTGSFRLGEFNASFRQVFRFAIKSNDCKGYSRAISHRNVTTFRDFHGRGDRVFRGSFRFTMKGYAKSNCLLNWDVRVRVIVTCHHCQVLCHLVVDGVIVSFYRLMSCHRAVVFLLSLALAQFVSGIAVLCLVDGRSMAATYAKWSIGVCEVICRNMRSGWLENAK